MENWEFVSQIWEIGLLVESFILESADIVASPRKAGTAALVIFIMLVIAGGFFWWGNYQKRRAVKDALSQIQRSSSKDNFFEKFQDIDEHLRNLLAKNKPNRFKKVIGHAWDEYSETLIMPSSGDDRKVILNTVRPGYFFNRGDLGFDRDWWRYLPGIFVSVGLFLTFLGIIAAFGNLVDEQSGGQNSIQFDDEKMGMFLETAQSKFIMSISGLFASIIFGIVYRWRMYGLDCLIAELAEAVESRVQFQTPEQIAVEQLGLVKEQSKIFQVIGNDIGTRVGEVIDEKFKNVVEGVTENSIENTGKIVNELGEALHAKLNESLNEMSKTLGSINRSLEGVSKSLVSESHTIGTTMESGVKNLGQAAEALFSKMKEQGEAVSEQLQHERNSNQEAISALLEAIEKNTRENSNRLEAATNEFATAVTSLSETIGKAGNAATEQTAETVTKISAEASQQMSNANREISSRLDEVVGRILENLSNFHEGMDRNLAEPIRQMAENLENSNQKLEEYADAIARSTTDQTRISDNISKVIVTLEEAGQPIADGVKNVVHIVVVIRDALSKHVEIMEATKANVDASLKAVDKTMENLTRVVAEVDDIDEKLGEAFKKISRELVMSQEQVVTYSEEITQKFTTGIQTIQNVLDGLEEFRPAGEEE